MLVLGLHSNKPMVKVGFSHGGQSGNGTVTTWFAQPIMLAVNVKGELIGMLIIIPLETVPILGKTVVPAIVV